MLFTTSQKRKDKELQADLYLVVSGFALLSRGTVKALEVTRLKSLVGFFLIYINSLALGSESGEMFSFCTRQQKTKDST